MDSPTASPLIATYSANEVARVLGISTAHVRKLARLGEMPGARRLGERWVFSKIEIQRWLEAAPEKAAA